MRLWKETWSLTFCGSVDMLLALQLLALQLLALELLALEFLALELLALELFALELLALVWCSPKLAPEGFLFS